MELKEVIAERRSVRAYRSRSIGQRKFRGLQRALQVAPSGGNRQEYSFIFVTDEKKRKRIGAGACHQDFIDKDHLIDLAV